MKAKKKYGKGGKLYNEGGKVKKLSRRKTVGAPMSNKTVERVSKLGKNSKLDMALKVPELRENRGGYLVNQGNKDRRESSNVRGYLKATQRSQEVPNPGLGKVTRRFNTGDAKKATEVTYSQGNPGGLKGRTSGKGGNVGAGMTAPTKKRRRRR